MVNQDYMKNPFVVFQTDKFHELANTSIKDLQQPSLLSRVFFSPENVKLIQKQIIVEIFRRSNGKYLIDSQNESDLEVVMRSIFLQNAKHIECNIKQQIRELNNLVVEAVLPDIIAEIEMNIQYLARTFGPTEIIDRPKNVSQRGLVKRSKIN